MKVTKMNTECLLTAAHLIEDQKVKNKLMDYLLNEIEKTKNKICKPTVKLNKLPINEMVTVFNHESDNPKYLLSYVEPYVKETNQTLNCFKFIDLVESYWLIQVYGKFNS